MKNEDNSKEQCCHSADTTRDEHNHSEHTSGEHHEEHCHDGSCSCHDEHHHDGGCSCHEHAHKAHACCCCHDDDEEEEGEITLKRIIFSLVLFIVALGVEHVSFFAKSLSFVQFDGVTLHRAIYLVLYFVAYIACGKDVLKSAVNNIRRGKVFDEKFLMAVASVGAIFLGEVGEAVAVMLFYNIGEFFQDYAVDKSRSSISALMDIRPDKAVVVRDGKTLEVAPNTVNIGELIEVKPGDRLPLDGTIEEGSSFMDTSALTGESVPRKVSAGSAVMAGFVNQQGVVRIRVTKTYGESAVSRILELTQKAGAVKARTEKFITRFAKWYTPVVCILAVVVAFVLPLALQVFVPAVFAQTGWHTWIYRALMFLVVSCPCAIVISVPLSFFSGIGTASRHGILIKGSNYIEALSKAELAVFDKTGTLTKGTFVVSRVLAVSGISEDELVQTAAHAEFYSTHPISKSLCRAHEERNLKNGLDNACCALCTRKAAEEISGHGVKIQLDGKTVLVGNEKLMAKENIQVDEQIRLKLNSKKTAGTVVHVAREQKYLGCIVISDELKEDSPKISAALKKTGVKQVAMLTGDNKQTAGIIAEQLSIDTVYSELLPEDKVNCVKKLKEQKTQKKQKGSLIYVGDGINDSPVLASADVGIAMGALGSDAAIEAADVVIMDDRPGRIIEAIKISRGTMAVVYQNIIFSLGVKVAIMILSSLGISNMWVAVFGDVGVCFLAILNALRIFKK